MQYVVARKQEHRIALAMFAWDRKLGTSMPGMNEHSLALDDLFIEQIICSSELSRRLQNLPTVKTANIFAVRPEHSAD